jgi:hypothetical protein
MKLYHFTETKNLPGIRTGGLRPRKSLAEDGAKWGEVVWFTTNGPGPGEARALVVEIDASDPRLKRAERLLLGDWYAYRGTIPPDQIDFGDE